MPWPITVLVCNADICTERNVSTVNTYLHFWSKI